MDQIPPVIGSKDRPKPAYGDVGALMGPEDPRGQSCSRRTRRTMTLNAFAVLSGLFASWQQRSPKKKYSPPLLTALRKRPRR